MFFHRWTSEAGFTFQPAASGRPAEDQAPFGRRGTHFQWWVNLLKYIWALKHPQRLGRMVVYIQQHRAEVWQLPHYPTHFRLFTLPTRWFEPSGRWRSPQLSFWSSRPIGALVSDPCRCVADVTVRGAKAESWGAIPCSPCSDQPLWTKRLGVKPGFAVDGFKSPTWGNWWIIVK